MYKAKFLPIGGEIKEGDKVWSIITNKPIPIDKANAGTAQASNAFGHKIAKLFLISDDIQVGDELLHLPTNKKFIVNVINRDKSGSIWTINSEEVRKECPYCEGRGGEIHPDGLSIGDECPKCNGQGYILAIDKTPFFIYGSNTKQYYSVKVIGEIINPEGIVEGQIFKEGQFMIHDWVQVGESTPSISFVKIK